MTTRRLAPAVAIAIALAAPAAAHGAETLTGPDGVSHRKVLVIGLDGVRWDLLREAIAAGRAPSLDRLGRSGLAMPTLLPYTFPQAATLSEVGWSTIATGVGPAKHGVIGVFLNNDPRQRTKNGYLDFLSRAERERRALSTFLASDWANIGRHEHGGPIFGDPIDTRHAVAAADSIEAYDQGDRDVADVAARYLRDGNPDAGFVYFGLIDEVSHIRGSATPAYLDSIATTDARVGMLLDAVRSRPSYGRERWTVIVTTDHGQRPLDYGTLLSHGFWSDLERTSFVIAAGPGVRDGARTDAPDVVDIAPTVLHQLGLRVDPAWRLDGSSFVRAAPAPPPPAVTVAYDRRRRAMTIRVRAAAGAPRVRSVALAMPRGLSLRTRRGRSPAVRFVGARRVSLSGRRLAARASGAGATRVTIRVGRGSLAISRSLERRLRRGGALTLRATVAEAGGEPASQQVAARVSR